MAESNVVLNILQYCKDVLAYRFVSQSPEHSEIHKGHYFQVDRSTSVLGASSWIDIQINTPSTNVVQIHCYFQLNNSGGLAEVVLCELSTSSTYSSTSVTQLNVINHNRTSTYVNNVTFFTGGVNTAFITSTMTSSQAKLLQNVYVGSTGTNAFGGNLLIAERCRDEFILKGNSTYIFRMYNRGSDGSASLEAVFYEL